MYRNRPFYKTLNNLKVRRNPLVGATSDTESHYGSVLAPNGKIYYTPHFGNNILEYNPISNTYRKIEIPVAEINNNNHKYSGGVALPNGKIYFCPCSSNKVLIYDTISDNCYVLPNNLGNATFKWLHMSLGNDGNLYAFPYQDNEFGIVNQNLVFGRMLKINTITEEISLNRFNNLFLFNSSIGTVLGVDGNFYSTPIRSTGGLTRIIYKYDINQQQASIHMNINFDFYCGFGSLGFDDKIYSGCIGGTHLLELDYLNKEWNGISNKGNGVIYSLQLAPNGLLYGENGNTPSLVVLNPITKNLNTFASRIISGDYNKGAYHTQRYYNGKIYLTPKADVLDVIENIGEHKPEYQEIPTDLSTLHLSLYNKFQNRR